MRSLSKVCLFSLLDCNPFTLRDRSFNAGAGAALAAMSTASHDRLGCGLWVAVLLAVADALMSLI
jgi:hypothetical protein